MSRHTLRLAFRAAALCLGSAIVGQRLAVPDQESVATAQAGALRTVIDSLLIDQGEFSPDIRSAQLLNLAIHATSPGVRYALFEHSLRIARERGSLQLHSTVLDAFLDEFEVDPLSRHIEELGGRRQRGDACARSLVICAVGALRDQVEGEHERAATAETTVLAWATESGDPRLESWATREIEGLRRARETWAQSVDSEDPDAVRAFRDAYGPLAGALAPTESDAPQKIDLIGRADQLRARARDETDPWVQGNLRRRAWRAYAQAWPVAQGLERVRIEKQLTRLEDLIAEAQTLGHLDFDDPTDLGEFVFARGHWKIRDGALRGSAGDAGTASTATLQLAFQNIDCVRIRGGIESDDGLNFRAAVGPSNLLLNWEVREESHFYVGENMLSMPKHMLVRGHTHDIRIRRLGRQIALFIDGQCACDVAGLLGGTIAVYPALRSAIFVDDLAVIGDLDPIAGRVEGPSHACR